MTSIAASDHTHIYNSPCNIAYTYCPRLTGRIFVSCIQNSLPRSSDPVASGDDTTPSSNLLHGLNDKPAWHTCFLLGIQVTTYLYNISHTMRTARPMFLFSTVCSLLADWSGFHLFWQTRYACRIVRLDTSAAPLYSIACSLSSDWWLFCRQPSAQGKPWQSMYIGSAQLLQ